MENPDIAGRLGTIQTTQGVIQANLENLRREFEREREGADVHRRGLSTTIAALSEAVRTLSSKMEDVQPLAIAYREATAEQRGMARLGRMVWAAAVGISALVGAIASKIIDHIK